jgi:hypothetical protein
LPIATSRPFHDRHVGSPRSQRSFLSLLSFRFFMHAQFAPNFSERLVADCNLSAAWLLIACASFRSAKFVSSQMVRGISTCSAVMSPFNCASRNFVCGCRRWVDGRPSPYTTKSVDRTRTRAKLRIATLRRPESMNRYSFGERTTRGHVSWRGYGEQRGCRSLEA